jgi:K+-transporting ATPase ATPase A chain
MTAQGWLTYLVLGVLLVISTPILGNYMAKVYTGQKVFGDRVAGPVERLIFRVTGIDPEGEQRWSTYAGSLLVFSLVGVLVLYAELRFQAHLPFNRGHISTADAFSPGAAFNVAVSFLTNTNWQVYTGETAASALTNFFGLVLQQFLSAAVGLAVVIALIRGLTRKRSRTLGSFWVDVTKSVTRILLPLSFAFAIVLMTATAHPRPPPPSPRSRPTRPPPPSRRPSSRSPGRRRGPSRCWATTVEASTTRTTAIRGRTRTPSRSCS